MTIKVGGGGGGSIGEIVKRHKRQKLDANHLNCDGSTYLWSAYTEYQTHCDSVPIGVEFTEIPRANLTAATYTANGAAGCYNTTNQDYVWPTGGANVVVVQSADHSASPATRTTGLASTYLCVASPTSAYVCVSSAASDATIAYDNANGYTGFSSTKVISTDDANFASNSKVLAMDCSDGGRFYVLGGVNVTSVDLAYSPVDNPAGTWVAWASGMPTLTGNTNTGVGGVAVKEGVAWLISFQSTTGSEAGNIWRATSLGGTFTKVLDAPTVGTAGFYLTYDDTTDTFIAIPSEGSAPNIAMYASTDNGATWVEGDKLETSLTNQYFAGRAQIYDTTNKIWVVPFRNNTFQTFSFIKIDSSGAPRLSTPYEYNDINISHTEGNGQGYPMVVHKNTRIIMNRGGQTTVTEIVPSTNFATQFYIPKLTSDGTFDNSQFSYSIKVK